MNALARNFDPDFGAALLPAVIDRVELPHLIGVSAMAIEVSLSGASLMRGAREMPAAAAPCVSD